jgi:hypothetical protein
MSQTMKEKVVIIASSLMLLVSLRGCNKTPPTAATENSNAVAAPSPSKPEPTPATAFERDMQYVRNSQFGHVWVFARKDGKPIDKDEAAYLRTNAPQVIDWIKTDDGKRVIAGTNFDLELGGLGLLKKRFVVEDWTGK